MVYHVLTLIPSPYLQKNPYSSPVTGVQKITLGSTMYVKAYFLNQCSTTKLSNSKNRIKTMMVNSKIKHKSKTILGVIRNLVPDFILFFVFVLIYEKVPYRCNISTEYDTKYIIIHYASLVEEKYFMTNNLQQ